MNTWKCAFIPALCLCLATAHAQESGRVPGICMRVGGGYGPVFHTPGWDPLVDPLVSLPFHNRSMAFELEGPLGRHFNILFQYSYLETNLDVRSEMTTRLSRQFPDDYVTLDVYSLKEDQPLNKKPVRGFVGCSYALDYGKWSLEPRFLIGGMTFYPIRADVVLKRPNSNQLSTLTLIPVSSSQNGVTSAFAAGLGVLLQRNLWGRLSAYVSGECITFKSPVGYSYLFENQVDDSVIDRTFGIDRPRFLFPAQFHLGLSFRLTSDRNFQKQ